MPNTNTTKRKKLRACTFCGGKADKTRAYDTNCTNPTCSIYGMNVTIERWNKS
jgi:hypothetical protein